LNILVNSPTFDSAEDAGGGGAGSARNAPELSMRVNSLSSALGAGSGQSPAAGLFGIGELNIRVNSPGPDTRADDEGGFAGALGRVGSAEGVRGGTLNILVNSPGPDTRDDAAGAVGIEAAGIDGSAGLPRSAKGAAGGALNMLVNSPGPDTRGDAAGVDGIEAVGVAASGIAASAGRPRSAEGAAGGALNMLVNSPGPDTRGDAAGVDGIEAVGVAASGIAASADLPRSAEGAAGGALNMFVNSSGPDTCDDAAGLPGIEAAGIAGSAAGAAGGALNILVNSPGLPEPGGAATGGIADRIAKVPPGVAGSSGNAGENAAGIACVLEATGCAGCGFPEGEEIGVVLIAAVNQASSAREPPCACGAAGVGDSPFCAA
jgi:hypothetical protein